MSVNSGALNESDALLIDGVRQTCILYNPSSADFRLAYKKEKAWEDLALDFGIKPIDAKRRWTCLRERYSRELRQIREKAPSVDCAGSELFHKMDFLRPFVKKRSTNRNPWKDKDSKMKLQLDDSQTQQSFSESTQDHYDDKLTVSNSGEQYNYEACELDPLETYAEYATEQPNYTTEGNTVPRTQQKGLKNETIPIVLSPMSESNNTANSSMQQTKLYATQQETEDDFFCKSVAMYLRKLSRRHKIKAKVEMFQILEKYIEIEENSATAIEQYGRQNDQRH